jgi:predicted methyltransferase
MIALNSPGPCRSATAAFPVAAVILTLALAGCSVPAEPESAAGATEAAPQTAGPVILDRAILDDPSRPQAERAEDSGRRPLEVYEFFGIEPRMTVADVYNADGYNTHLLSRVVGGEGRVFSVFEFYGDPAAFDGQFYKVDSVTERLRTAGLDNVELALRLAEIPSDSVDVAIAIRNYHDVQWVVTGLRRDEQVAQLFRVIKAGGIVGIVDVATDAEGWDEANHRLNKQVVIDDFTGGGFELVEESDLLANSADRHDSPGFTEGRQTLDRYTLKFRKPAG